MATNELEILRRIRERAASLRAGMEETEGSGLFTADRDQEDREALSRADRLLADRGMDGGDGQLRASPGGVLPFQAEFLRRLQESGQQVTTPQREFEQVTTRPERIMARFGSGLASELTLGREELLGVEQEGLRQARDILNVEQIERRPDEGFFSFAGRAIANSDIEDWADAMGHVAGALPLAVLTGGTANLLARGGLTHATRVGQQATRAAQTARTLADVEQATRVARRAQGAQRLFSVLAREVPEQAGVGMRLLRGATANVFEGAAYSAVAGPARRLEEGQSRGRAIAQEFGIGAAADFVLGMVLGVPGARLGRFAENLRNSDNSIDREMGDAIQRRLTEGAQPEPVNPERIVRPRGPRPGTLPAGSRGELPELPAARGPAGRLTRPRTEGGPAGLLPPEAGGPRLARGETLPPERARAREDVQMERDLPFLSRLRGEAVPAVPRPPLRGPLAPRPDRLLPPEAGGPRIAGGEVAERAERVPGGLPFMTRPVRPERPALPPGERPAAAEPVQEAEALRAPEEDPTAPETLRAEPVEEAVAEPVDISGLRGNVRRAAEEIQQAETPGEVMTAASNLRAQRVRPEDQEVVRTLIERKMGELGEAGPAARGVGPTRGTVDPQERIRALEQEVTELRTAAETDVVTGLRNRRGDQRATEQALQERAPGEEIVRMQGDMDAFKAVNDILGHDVGDELLGEVGRVLDAQFRPEDQISVARHGGDEFSATMRVAPGADVEAIRDRVEAAVAEAIERLGINQRLRDAGFDESVGFSLVGRRVPEGGTRGDVDRELDRALQRRKRERGAGGLEARRRREAQLRGEEEPPPAGPSEA
ncbi:MAG: diguanylate cyclase domain-containing protein, partial [Gemmatimonadota bacterium]